MQSKTDPYTKSIDSEKLLEGLNNEQAEAVVTNEGPLIIIAGAGTGKTKVITNRIAYIIANSLAKPEEILALTFTDKACEDMRDRLDRTLPYGLGGSDIFTFHSFGDSLLRENALSIGITPDYTLMTTAEEIYFFREHLFLFPLAHFRPLGNPTKFIDTLISYFSKIKDEDISVVDYNKYIVSLQEEIIGYPKGEKGLDILEEEFLIHKELLDCFKAYEETKLKEGFITFADLISLSLNTLRTHPTILSFYQKKYKYILVDEFQDTNYTQNELVKMLSNKHKNICVCGDDDQSIYKFRGASISNIMTFGTAYPDSKKIVLTKNYRSNQQILDAAYSLITKNNPDRLEIVANIDKKLLAKGESKNYSVTSIGFPALLDEMQYISEEIEKLTTEDSTISFKDIAILIRSNAQSQDVLRELKASGIPAIFQGTSGLYETKEIRPILAFLYSLARFDDSINLFHLASSHFYSLDMSTLIACNALTRGMNKPLSYIFNHIDELEELDIKETEKEVIGQILNDLSIYREKSREENIGTLLLEFLQEKGYTEKIENGLIDHRIENIQRLFKRIDRFLTNNKDGSIQEFCNYLDYTREIGDDPMVDETDSQIDAVNIITIHKAKGLEYNSVFMIDLIEGRFPSKNRSESIQIPIPLVKETLPSGNFHIQEERRLFYVGMTRAKEHLYLLWAKDYYQKTKKRISPFIVETNILQKEIEPLSKENLQEADNKKIDPISIEKNDDKNTTIISLSQSSIDDYLTCPMKYEYKYKYKVNTSTSFAQSYGTLIHSLIQQILKRQSFNDAISESELDDMYEQLWQSRGYLSEEHMDLMFKAGKETLHNFLKEFKIKSIYIEKSFNVKVNDNLNLQGRWDFISDDTDIVDFKTSRVLTQKEANKKAMESNQLKIYAYAYLKVFNTLPKSLSLYFVSTNIKGTIIPNEKMITKAHELLLEVGNGIANHEFEAKPTYTACKSCAFNKICSFTMAT